MPIRNPQAVLSTAARQLLDAKNPALTWLARMPASVWVPPPDSVRMASPLAAEPSV
jgi:hypothetical protein